MPTLDPDETAPPRRSSPEAQLAIGEIKVETAPVSAAQRAAWDRLWRRLLAPLPEEEIEHQGCSAGSEEGVTQPPPTRVDEAEQGAEE